jgi:regulator of replication initiation timing
MDKQIKKYCEGLDCYICNEKEPCIYKIANELEEKLKAKEQECEAYKMEAEEGIEINAELKAENEKLKQYKSSKQASYETMQREWNEAKNEVKKLKAENEELKGLNIGLVHLLKYEFNRIIKLRMCLQDIKEVAEEKAKVNDWLALEILQKINEVEE